MYKGQELLFQAKLSPHKILMLAGLPIDRKRRGSPDVKAQI